MTRIVMMVIMIRVNMIIMTIMMMTMIMITISNYTAKRQSDLANSLCNQKVDIEANILTEA